MDVVGLDIGGANTKAAVVSGDGASRLLSEPYEIWRDLGGLSAAVAGVVEGLDVPGAPVALTTTAELSDVFASKREGVARVLDAAEEALPGRELRVFTTTGELVGMAAARERPLEVAAANWLASAMLVARSVSDAIFVDCGGTTTDVIPIAAGAVAARGRTDVERLLRGELVYTGALRTNVAAIVQRVPLAAGECPVASELFAISADAYLLLGRLSPQDCTCSFPDGRGTSPDEVRARLARVVCADPEQLADGDLEAIATAVEVAQVDTIAAALGRMAPAPVVAVGVGAFLARAAAERCGLALHDAGPLSGPGGDVAAAVALSVLGRG